MNPYGPGNMGNTTTKTKLVSGKMYFMSRPFMRESVNRLSSFYAYVIRPRLADPARVVGYRTI